MISLPIWLFVIMCVFSAISAISFGLLLFLIIWAILTSLLQTDSKDQANKIIMEEAKELDEKGKSE